MATPSIAFVVRNMALSQGVQRMVANLSNEWAARRWEVHIICTEQSQPLFYSIDDSITIHYLGINNALNSYGALSALYNRYRLIGLLRKQIKHARYRFVIGIDAILNCSLAVACWRLPTKTIGWVHSNFGYANFNKAWIFIIKKTFIYLDALVLLTPAELLFYKKMGVKHIVIIPNFSTLQVAAIAKFNNKKLLAVGALLPFKGYDKLVQLAAPVLTDHPGWQLDIVGEGPLRDHLMALVQSLSMEGKITVCPPSLQIETYYAQSSIFVHTSSSEAFPMVFVEAMNNGLPCLAYDCPTGPRYIIASNINGQLIPLDEAAEFAKQLRTLMENPAQYETLQQGALATSMQYQPAAILKHWDDLLRTLS